MDGFWWNFQDVCSLGECLHSPSALVVNVFVLTSFEFVVIKVSPFNFKCVEENPDSQTACFSLSGGLVGGPGIGWAGVDFITQLIGRICFCLPMVIFSLHSVCVYTSGNPPKCF